MSNCLYTSQGSTEKRALYGARGFYCLESRGTKTSVPHEREASTIKNKLFNSFALIFHGELTTQA